LYGDVGLLKLMVQVGEAQHRLCQACGEHLKRDQHGNGEAAMRITMIPPTWFYQKYYTFIL